VSNVQPLRVSPGQIEGVGNAGIEATPRRSRALMVLVLGYGAMIIPSVGIAVLLEPIKHDFGLSDSAEGAIPGMSMVLAFILFGIPAGLLVDRVNRRNLLVGAMLIAGVASALGAFVTGFWGILASRFVAGVAQTPAQPAQMSMISDLYPPERRSTAFGILALGVPLGMILGYLPPSLLITHYGWRTALFAMGMPCILAGLLTLALVREPKRAAHDTLHTLGYAADQPVGLREALGVAWARPALACMIGGQAFAALAGGVYLAWLPALLQRNFHMAPAWIGVAMALGNGLFGGIGTFSGGMLADRMAVRDIRWKAHLPSGAMIGCLITSIAMISVSGTMIAVVILCTWAIFWNSQIGPSYDLLQSLSPVRARGKLMACVTLLQVIGSVALGPLITGIISQYLTRYSSQNSVRFALLGGALLNIPSIYFYLRAGRTLKADLAQAHDG
jgi:predicted MFS family arabinose efflux permease